MRRPVPADAISVRDATADDEPFLWAMLAASVHAGPPWSVDQAQAEPAIAQHLTGWPRPGDIGVVATSASDAPVGAAWLRQFTAEDRSHAFVARDLPELAMAVVADARGCGVGALLLRSLLDRARAAGVERVSLSVNPTNVVARRLYERFGFEPADVAPDPGGSLILVVAIGS